MAVVAMKQLLEAGVHFGHQTRRWNPKMAEYIFQARNGIHIIDLQKTSKKLDEAYHFVKEQAEQGNLILFVGTKKQAQECMKESAIKCNMYYVDQRWLGGMLTNFDTIQKRVNRLRTLESMETDGTFEKLPKKEVIKLKAEQEKLEKNLGGIKEMKQLPSVLFIVDPNKERIAILEAKKLNIPVVGLVDTNCSPEHIDYIIPGNDDAIRAVRLIADVMANAVIEGREGEAPEVTAEQEMLEKAGAPKSIEEVVATREELPIVAEEKAVAVSEKAEVPAIIPEEKVAPKLEKETAEEAKPEEELKKETKKVVKKASKENEIEEEPKKEVKKAAKKTSKEEDNKEEGLEAEAKKTTKEDKEENV